MVSLNEYPMINLPIFKIAMNVCLNTNVLVYIKLTINIVHMGNDFDIDYFWTYNVSYLDFRRTLFYPILLSKWSLTLSKCSIILILTILTRSKICWNTDDILHSLEPMRLYIVDDYVVIVTLVIAFWSFFRCFKQFFPSNFNDQLFIYIVWILYILI